MKQTEENYTQEDDMHANDISRNENIMISRYAKYLILLKMQNRLPNMNITVLLYHAMQLCRGAIAGAMLYVGAMVPRNANADLVMVANASGSSGVGSSVMYTSNQEGGSLGEDSGDSYSWERPPGSPDNWLRVYSDQNNQYYGVSGYEQSIDNRPFSGDDSNQAFPLVLDTQGPNPITANGNYVQFQLQSAIDQLRPFYIWTMSLSNGAVFTDSSTTKSGVWVLAESSTHSLPAYNLTNVQGAYGTLDVRPSAVFVVTTTTAGAGAIFPVTPTNLFWSYTTNFLIETDNEDHHISSVALDGGVLFTNAAQRGIQSTNIGYTVTNNGTIYATFTPSTTASGIPLTWLTEHGVTNKQDDVEGQDLDGDTYTVFQEYLADTHPTNGTSFFPPVSLEVTDGTLRFGIDPTSDARRYYIEATTNLVPADWQPVTNAPGTGGAWTVEPALPPEDSLYYRGKVTLP